MTEGAIAWLESDDEEIEQETNNGTVEAPENFEEDLDIQTERETVQVLSKLDDQKAFEDDDQSVEQRLAIAESELETNPSKAQNDFEKSNINNLVEDEILSDDINLDPNGISNGKPEFDEPKNDNSEESPCVKNAKNINKKSEIYPGDASNAEVMQKFSDNQDNEWEITSDDGLSPRTQVNDSVGDVKQFFKEEAQNLIADDQTNLKENKSATEVLKINDKHEVEEALAHHSSDIIENKIEAIGEQSNASQNGAVQPSQSVPTIPKQTTETVSTFTQQFSESNLFKNVKSSANEYFKDVNMNNLMTSFSNYPGNFTSMLKKSAEKIALTPNLLNNMLLPENLDASDQEKENDGQDDKNQNGNIKNNRSGNDLVSRKLTFDLMLKQQNGDDLIFYFNTINDIWNNSNLSSPKKSLSTKTKGSPFDDQYEFETNYDLVDKECIYYFKNLFSNLAQSLMINVKIETWVDDWYNFEKKLSFAAQLVESYEENRKSFQSDQLRDAYKLYLYDLALFVVTNAKFIKCLCENIMYTRGFDASEVMSGDPNQMQARKKLKSLNSSTKIVNQVQQLYRATSPVLKYIGQKSFELFTRSNFDKNTNIGDFQTRILCDVLIAKSKLNEIYNFSLPFISN